MDDGGEHLVHDAAAEPGRIFKIIHPGNAGLTLRAVAAGDDFNVKQSSASAREYLERMVLTNEVFGGGIRFEGVIDGELPSLVISQAMAIGVHPETADINRFLREMGFERVDPLMWYRPHDGLAISDTKRANFITPDGGQTVLPIDLPIRRASPEMAKAWGFQPPPSP